MEITSLKMRNYEIIKKCDEKLRMGSLIKVEFPVLSGYFAAANLFARFNYE